MDEIARCVLVGGNILQNCVMLVEMILIKCVVLGERATKGRLP